MENKVRGTWYNDVLLDLNYPEIADVSVNDYVAKSFKGNQMTEEQRPFQIAHPAEVTLKVEPWLGEVVVWTFAPGAFPMRIRRILKDPVNTATSIQIAY